MALQKRGSSLPAHKQMGRRSLIAACFILAVVLLSLRFMNSEQMTDRPSSEEGNGGLKYSIVPDVFSPSVDGTESSSYDYITTDFGLIDRSYDSDVTFDPNHEASQWARLKQYVSNLNAASPANTQYKLLYLGRHGEGWHNVAEKQYGREEWDAHWSLLEGDGTLHWADAVLTPVGETQALAAHSFFAERLGSGLPAPDSYYTSPLSRCLQTCNFTFTGLELPQEKPFRPVVKELLRETNGEHTCDRRSSLTQLRAAFPKSFMSTFTFEPGFSDKDWLWSPTERETDEETQARVRKLLDDIFEHDRGSWISLTSHSGAIRAILAVLGHREFRLGQGSMMAVLACGEKVDDP